MKNDWRASKKIVKWLVRIFTFVEEVLADRYKSTLDKLKMDCIEEEKERECSKQTVYLNIM